MTAGKFCICFAKARFLLVKIFSVVCCYDILNLKDERIEESMKQEEMERLCQLAKLSLEPEEKQELTQEMDEIIAFAHAVCEIASSMEETDISIEMTAPLREDQMKQFHDPQALLYNTEQSKDGFFFLQGKR